MKFKMGIFFIMSWLFSISRISAQDNSKITLQLPIIAADTKSDTISSIEVISNLTDSVFIGILPSSLPNVRTDVIITQGVR